MKKENQQGKKLKEESSKRERNKKTTQAAVLKQLNSQSLYPLQERIGMYVIAVLSAVMK